MEEIDITSQLFQQASLITTSFKMWSGLVSESKGQDKEVTGDDKLRKSGQIWLVDKESFKNFTAIRANYDRFTGSMSHDFCIRSVRLVPHKQMEAYIAQLHEFRNAWMDERDAFMAKLPSLKAAQSLAWDAKYPSRAGKLAELCPSDADIFASFNMDWMIFRIDTARLDEVYAGEREKLRSYTQNYCHQLAGEFRAKVVEICLSFTKALDVKSGEVNEKKIASFKEFLSKIEQYDMLGDDKMKTLLSNMKESVFGVQNWSSEEVAQTKIRDYLDEAVKIGQDAGEVAQVASAYIRRVSTAQETGEQEEEDETPQVPAISRTVAKNEN